MTKYEVKCALKRAIRTIAQTAAAMIGTAVTLSEVDWKVLASASILAGILSILTSIVTGLPEAELDEEETEYEDFNEEELEDEDDGVEYEDPADDEVLPQ